MSPDLLSLLAVIVLAVLLALRTPIAYAMAGVGLIGMFMMRGFDSSLQLVASDVFRQFGSLSMAVIPLFTFMGQIVYHTGMSTKLFDASYKWSGRVPGGLAVTTLTSSALFSAVSGSNTAGTATIGAIALPEMEKYKYDRKFAGGTVAIGGTLGILIPPSTALVIVAVQAEQSLVTLFRASIAPSLILVALLIITVLVFAKLRPAAAPMGPKFSWGERFRSLNGVVEIVVLFFVSVVGMLLGWFTPTEAAGVGAFGALVISVVTRQMTWRKLVTATIETLRISAFVLLLVVSAIIFGRFLALTRMPFHLADWAAELPVAPVVVLLLIIGVYLIGGAIMDGLGFLVLSIPLFFPLLQGLGYNPIWVTMIVILVTTFGAVSPPIGVNLFIVSGITKGKITLMDTFKGTLPYYIPYGIAIAAFIIWPDLIMFAV